MLAFAQQQLGAQARVLWQMADAMNLPFDGKMFDAVICQFGMMFVPEKNAVMTEAHRVLKPGGTFFFNVWDSLAENDLTRVAHQTYSRSSPMSRRGSSNFRSASMTRKRSAGCSKREGFGRSI